MDVGTRGRLDGVAGGLRPAFVEADAVFVDEGKAATPVKSRRVTNRLRLSPAKTTKCLPELC
jgi:hypothetical protein